LLIALAAQRGGASHVILSDIDPAKLDAARTLGIEHLVDARTTTPDVFAHDLCRGADLVIEATGSTNGYEKCILSAKTFGRVVLLGNPLAAMNLPQSSYWVILRKELQVTGSWNSVYRYCGDNDWTKALQMMASGFPAIKLVTHRVGLEELSAALRMMRDRTDFFTKVVCIP
jgi:L-iditol 2-dehydrogenase